MSMQVNDERDSHMIRQLARNNACLLVSSSSFIYYTTDTCHIINRERDIIHEEGRENAKINEFENFPQHIK